MRGINKLHKIRKLVTKNKTGDVYGITIPKIVGKKYYKKNMVIIKNSSLGKYVSMKTIKNFEHDIFFLIPENIYKKDFYYNKVC